jgi:hypothetical protein
MGKSCFEYRFVLAKIFDYKNRQHAVLNSASRLRAMRYSVEFRHCSMRHSTEHFFLLQILSMNPRCQYEIQFKIFHVDSAPCGTAGSRHGTESTWSQISRRI